MSTGGVGDAPPHRFGAIGWPGGLDVDVPHLQDSGRLTVINLNPSNRTQDDI